MIRSRLRRFLDRGRERDADFAGGTAAPMISPLPDHHGPAGDPDGADGRDAAMRDDPDEVDRLVHLAFAALLRREADRDTLLAYREGFATGTTFRDLVDDLVASDEYRSGGSAAPEFRPPIACTSAVPQDAPSIGGMTAAMGLLATRLAEKGCRLPLYAPSAADDPGRPADPRRMRSLLVTLSLLDRL